MTTFIYITLQYITKLTDGFLQKERKRKKRRNININKKDLIIAFNKLYK